MRWIVCLLVAALCYCIPKCTHNFQLAPLYSYKGLALENRGDPSAVKAALSQEFTFFACGGQTHVFLSKDGAFVLKLFKNVPHPFVPLPSYRARKESKLRRDVGGYLLAFDRLQGECALLFVHGKPNSGAEPLLVTLHDALGIKHTLDLEPLFFVLQKRGTPLSTVLETSPSPKASLEQVKTLLHRRAEALIADHDPQFFRNIGFIGQDPVFLDPGRFTHDEHPSEEFPEKFVAYLQRNCPQAL